ncbi:MAG: type II secretion system protein GspG [Gammaproteobacteria bacterium]|nr:type II secretion system protein GspG [Gammaproteobacteria bacterium]
MKILFNLSKSVFKFIIVLFALIGLVFIWLNFTSDMHDKNYTSHKIAANLYTLESALNRFKSDVGRMPTQKEGLNILVYDNLNTDYPDSYSAGGYLSVLPKDPWGYPYIYLQSATAPFQYLICTSRPKKSFGLNSCKILLNTN